MGVAAPDLRGGDCDSKPRNMYRLLMTGKSLPLTVSCGEMASLRLGFGFADTPLALRIRAHASGTASVIVHMYVYTGAGPLLTARNHGRVNQRSCALLRFNLCARPGMKLWISIVSHTVHMHGDPYGGARHVWTW